jgi:predicted RNase H-like nuclease (RuvC/YqgF family)
MEKKPIDISEDVVMKTKFALDVKTLIAAATGIASLVGMWYMLQADIQEAKELPKIGNIYNQEYPSRPEGYNWPRSYEQYKDQVGNLQEDMDEVYDKLEEYEEAIEELEKTVTDLRIKLANKRDK